MFVDEVEVDLKAGDGGNGCASFLRQKYLPKGGPNGGDGGRGGDLILECDPNTADLVTFYYKPKWHAKNGEPGRGKEQYGKQGSKCHLKLPPGTVVIDHRTGRPVAELLEYGEIIILLKGGKGGFGNLHFKSSTNRAPRQFTEGKLGEEGRYKFILKSIADVGLVGYPNAGKSSLTGLLTKSNPKTAAYPFTTLRPNVGVVEYGDRFDRLYIADIPGLIEGAHENRGLGHRFLRHIERCQVLLLLIDMAGSDGRKPIDDYHHLVEELNLYDPELLKRDCLIAGNKMDDPAAKKHLKAFLKAGIEGVISISCLTEEGIPDLREVMYNAVKMKWK